jgi:CO/xanthine dehydrogenase Mo-binding subunit
MGQSVGRPLPRKEGIAKVTGAARYVDDLRFPGMLYGVTVRSTIARGRIRSIRFDEGFPWEECTTVTSGDIPGSNTIALITDDQPCLAEDQVRHHDEPIVLVAHEDRYHAEEARRRVGIEYDPLPAEFDMTRASQVYKTFRIDKGEVEAAFQQPGAVIVEGEYSTAAQEQLYIEPQGMIAIANPLDGITVWGSMQCPYYVHKALMKLFAVPGERVRVVQCETGGGFGGKEEYPSMIAAHAALLAWKSGRPVKMIYDRAEDIAATTKRHPSRTRIRTAHANDGRLLGIDIDFLLDGGAYCTLSPVVLSRGTIHAAGPYHCDNIRVRSRAVATNHPPHGAFRGFGAPQSIFAMERHLDRAAAALNLPPEELRRRNFLRKGQTTSTGQVIEEDIDLSALLDRALKESGYQEKRGRFQRENPLSPVKKGIGLATFMHGAGFTGAGEVYLNSVAAVEATAEGRVRILVSSTEIGQGTNTILCQIAADSLGIPYDQVEAAQPDTAAVPNSGPTVASRTCMVVGKLVESAAKGLLQSLAPYQPMDFGAACAAYVRDHGPLLATSRYQPPPGIHWDEENYRGEAYAAYAWAVYVAEVSVDTTTWECRVEDFVAVQEVGKVIHPVLAAGQIEGGVAQAIGWALYEDVVYENGRVVNAQMTNYIMPTSMDLPPIRVFFAEKAYPHGPYGAKGIGELPMDGPAPAIVNAIAQATGADLNRVPVTAEVLLEAAEPAYA